MDVVSITEEDQRLLDEATLEQLTLPIPKLDGYTSDRLVLSIGGSIELDRADDHLALLESMRLGQDVDLVVTARVSGKGFVHAIRVKDDEEDDVVGYQVKLKAHTVRQVGA